MNAQVPAQSRMANSTHSLNSDCLWLSFTSTVVGERMPFFLVTHRSLVEADSEQAAAVKALDKIESSRKLEFEVKFDETTITCVMLDRALEEMDSSSPEGQALHQKPFAGTTNAGQSPDENLSRTTIPERPNARTTTMVAAFLGGLVLATFMLAVL